MYSFFAVKSFNKFSFSDVSGFTTPCIFCPQVGHTSLTDFISLISLRTNNIELSTARRSTVRLEIRSSSSNLPFILLSKYVSCLYSSAFIFDNSLRLLSMSVESICDFRASILFCKVSASIC